jgi:hypothetical protein
MEKLYYTITQPCRNDVYFVVYNHAMHDCRRLGFEQFCANDMGILKPQILGCRFLSYRGSGWRRHSETNAWISGRPNERSQIVETQSKGDISQALRGRQFLQHSRDESWLNPENTREGMDKYRDLQHILWKFAI